MARRATLRASDSDREQIAERLRKATGEGRLAAEELEERLMASFKARTYGELDQLVSDLPGGRVVERERSTVTHWVPRAFALAIAASAVLVVLAMAVFIITGVLAGWLLWMAIGWWFFGHRRHGRNARRYPRSYDARYGARCGTRRA